MNLESCLHRRASHFGADELYLECSVKFPKNMVSYPIELIDKTLPFRGPGSELGLPHLLTFFSLFDSPAGDPPPRLHFRTVSRSAHRPGLRV